MVHRGPRLFNIFNAVLVGFSEDPEIARDLVHLEEDLEDVVGVKADPLTCARGAVWGMLCAGD